MISLRIARIIERSERNTLLRRLVAAQHLTAPTIRNRSFKSVQKEEVELEEIDPNEPIKFSTSNAAKWHAADIRTERDRPPFERTIVGGSVIAFMIYFFILREENDIDEAITSPIQDRLAYAEVEYNSKKRA